MAYAVVYAVCNWCIVKSLPCVGRVHVYREYILIATTPAPLFILRETCYSWSTLSCMVLLTCFTIIILSRFLYCLQLCDDIRANKVHVDRETAIRLNALMLQGKSYGELVNLKHSWLMGVEMTGSMVFLHTLEANYGC